MRIRQFLISARLALKAIFTALEWRQRYGPVIGDRKTPVFSVWSVDLKPRWKKNYWFWQVIGTDGDMMMTKNGLYIPASLQLTYIRLFQWKVIQIATVNYGAHYSGSYPQQALTSSR